MQPIFTIISIKKGKSKQYRDKVTELVGGVVV